MGELDKLLKDLGITCNADELAQMVQDADDDDDGEIDPDEWNQIGEQLLLITLRSVPHYHMPANGYRAVIQYILNFLVAQ